VTTHTLIGVALAVAIGSGAVAGRAGPRDPGSVAASPSKARPGRADPRLDSLQKERAKLLARITEVKRRCTDIRRQIAEHPRRKRGEREFGARQHP
jgi:hypothetical protein